MNGLILDHMDARRRLLPPVPCGTVIAHDGWPPPHAATASGLSLYASSVRESAYRAVSADGYVTPECERTPVGGTPFFRLRPLRGTGRPPSPRDRIGQDPDHSRASNPVKAETGAVCAGQRCAASIPPADEEPAGIQVPALRRPSLQRQTPAQSALSLKEVTLPQRRPYLRDDQGHDCALPTTRPPAVHRHSRFNNGLRINIRSAYLLHSHGKHKQLRRPTQTRLRGHPTVIH